MGDGDTITRNAKGAGGKVLIIALTILATGMASLLGWVGRSFDAKIAETQKENQLLRKRLDAVEAAEAKWGTFAEIKQESVRLREEAAYTWGRLDALSSLLSGVGAPRPKAQGLEYLPDALQKLEPPPPRLEAIDPDEFRAAQQQKYPVKK